MSGEKKADILPVRLPFSGGDNPEITRRLLEIGTIGEISLLKRIYYRFARPLMPLPLRHWLQERVTSKIQCKPDYIDDSLVNWIEQHLPKKSVSSFYPMSPGGNRYQSAVVMTHDVETQAVCDFIPKVTELEAEYGITSSWNFVPNLYNIDTRLLEELRNTGHEIGIHGYNHDGKLYFSKAEFNSRMLKINLAAKCYNTCGFRSPMVQRNLSWLQQLDTDYDASCFDYDPYQPMPGGTGSIWPFQAGRLIELPYTLPQDHTLFYVLKQKNCNLWKRKADWVRNHKGVVLLITHPDYLMEPGNLKVYEKLLKHLTQWKDSWFCLPREIAAHTRKKLNALKN
ncbi:MAG: hypothetical protein K8S56_04825 [Candidatus Cloacimonetes bacterium]|nr:hypothetical protein [Candidatus Cloacimonadota bacterium]